jgi:MFS family permease
MSWHYAVPVSVVGERPSQPAEPGRGNVRALFDIRGFRRLLAMRLTSQFSDGLFQAALAGSVLFNPAQQSSPAKIATGFAVLLVPFSILGPFVGVFLDRWSRRNIIYVANMLRAALALPAAVLIWTGGIGVPFFACALLIAAINRFFLAGLSAALPHVVPEPLLVTNNATSSTLGTVAYSLGLGTTAVALHTILHTNNTGYGWLCVAGAAGYLSAALLARSSFGHADLGPDRSVPITGTVASEIVAVVRGMVAGAQHLAERRAVAAAMGVQALCRTLYGVLTIATLLLYSRFFYDNYTSAIGGLGQVVVVGSIGAVAAAFITPYATRSIGGRLWIVTLTAMVAVVLPPLALPFVPILLVVATFLMNLSSQGIKIVVDTNVQVHCDESFRGRVFSVADTLFNVFFVIGLFVGALALPDDGHSVTAIVVIAAGYLVVAALYATVTRRNAPLEAIAV